MGRARKCWLVGLRTVFTFLLIMAAASMPSSTARTELEVDLVLVLALDVSSSVDASEFVLQRDGLARAISSPDVVSALSAGPNKKIAVSVVQWSGFTEQQTKINWTILASPADVARFAAQVAAMTRRYNGGATDIGGALRFTGDHALAAPFSAPRRVVDVAGDGKNNVNASPAEERNRLVAAGVTINGLAITDGTQKLVEYYRQNVIGGPGSFVESATGYKDFELAMKRKLLREIGAPFLS